MRPIPVAQFTAGIVRGGAEEHILLLLRVALEARGHETALAADGDSAVRRVSKEAFDVMLLDLRMPGLGGLGALRRLSETGLPCEVVVLTGQPDYDDCV